MNSFQYHSKDTASYMENKENNETFQNSRKRIFYCFSRKLGMKEKLKSPHTPCDMSKVQSSATVLTFSSYVTQYAFQILGKVVRPKQCTIPLQSLILPLHTLLLKTKDCSPIKHTPFKLNQ